LRWCEGKNVRCGRRFLLQNANTEHNTLYISRGLVWVAESVPMTIGVEYLRCLRWCEGENARTGAGENFHLQMPIPSATHLISVGLVLWGLEVAKIILRAHTKFSACSQDKLFLNYLHYKYNTKSHPLRFNGIWSDRNKAYMSKRTWLLRCLYRSS